MNEHPYGGFPPHQKHSDTSLAAAVAVQSVVDTKRGMVYRTIRLFGSDGVTDDELAAYLGWDGSSVRPRRCELAHPRMGPLIRKSGEKRKTRSGRDAAVWVAVKDDALRHGPGRMNP